MSEFTKGLMTLIGTIGLFGLVLMMIMGPLVVVAMVLTYVLRIAAGRKPRFLTMGTILLAVSAFAAWFSVGCAQIGIKNNYPDDMFGAMVAVTLYGMCAITAAIIAGMSVANIVTED